LWQISRYVAVTLRAADRSQNATEVGVLLRVRGGIPAEPRTEETLALTPPGLQAVVSRPPTVARPDPWLLPRAGNRRRCRRIADARRHCWLH